MARGLEGVRQAAAEVEAKRRGSGGPQALWFSLKAGEEAVVRFLEQGDTDFPYWCNAHVVPVEGRAWGKLVTCLDQERDGTACPGCERELQRKFQGYVNMIWFEAPVYKRDDKNRLVKDSTGDKVVVTRKAQIAVWTSGIRLFEELGEVDANFRGLSSRPFRIKRKGEGLDTKYHIAPADPDSGAVEMTDEQKKLAESKYDLNEFVTAGSYEEFLKDLGETGSSGGNTGGAPTARPNPFMKNR